MLRSRDGDAVQQERYYLTHNRRLGAEKHRRDGATKDGICFSVWAPNARKVEVVFGTFFDVNDPKRTPRDDPLPATSIAGGYIADDGQGMHPERGPFPMTRGDGGVWVTDENDPRLADFAAFDHKPYIYRITKDDGTVAYKSDLYSRCQVGSGMFDPKGQPFSDLTRKLDGPGSCSAVVDSDQVTAFFEDPQGRWPESNWVQAEEFWKDEKDLIGTAKPVPRRVDDLVIYELHVGALGGPDKKGPGTLKDAIEQLDYLVDLGVNAVELLPMSQFSGEENWGYGTSHYYAIEYSGGGRDQYKYFIKACHRRGIAVIFDVVYNHFTPNAERAEWGYDTNDVVKNPYYWYEGVPSDYPAYQQAVDAGARDLGGYVDNMSTGFAPRFYEEMVRKMFISSAVMLMEEFHIDGFRVDQTTSIHSYNVLHADGRPVPNANLFGAKFLREWTSTLRLINPDVILTAEDHSGWDKVTQSTEIGGLGFDKVWYADFYHHLMGDTDKGSDYAKLIKTAGFGDDRALAMDYFAGVLGGSGGNQCRLQRVARRGGQRPGHQAVDRRGRQRRAAGRRDAAVRGGPVPLRLRRHRTVGRNPHVPLRRGGRVREGLPLQPHLRQPGGSRRLSEDERPIPLRLLPGPDPPAAGQPGAAHPPDRHPPRARRQSRARLEAMGRRRGLPRPGQPEQPSVPGRLHDRQSAAPRRPLEGGLQQRLRPLWRG